MPTYNSARFVSDSIASIVAQTFTDWELLISDDCSTDNTLNIIKSYAIKDNRVKYFSLDKNQGAARARNNSIAKAKGTYIAFLDSDDKWRESKLSKQVTFMETNDCNLAYSAYELIDEDGVKLDQVVDNGAPDIISYRQLLHKKATFGCLTVIFKRSSFSDFLMPDIRTTQDYALWLKLLRQTEHAHKVPGVLADYRIVSGSISRNKYHKARRQWQVYRDLERLPLLEALLAFKSYAWRAVFRY